MTAIPARTIGIVTINDDNNYGNRLQNYALQVVLSGLGWNVETIRNSPQPWPGSLLIPRTLHDLQYRPDEFIRRRTSRLRARLPSTQTQTPSFLGQRRQAIARFTDAFIHTSDRAFADMPPDYWSARYAKVVAGSDQVWNPDYRRAQGFDFLDFAEPHNRVAYAASFGVTAVPRFLHERYAGWLAQIPYLSVREQAAAGIVLALTGRTVPVVVDPTMLVDRATWDGLISAEPRISDGPYAVRFLLGPSTPTQQAWLATAPQQFADRVVDLHDLTQPANAEVGPAGFIAAIAQASVVITDSFHASIFAMLYRRPLIVRSRFRQDSRIHSLLSTHGIALERTGVEGIGVLDAVDWEAADAARERSRGDSSDFLRTALSAD